MDSPCSRVRKETRLPPTSLQQRARFTALLWQLPLVPALPPLLLLSKVLKDKWAFWGAFIHFSSLICCLNAVLP